MILEPKMLVQRDNCLDVGMVKLDAGLGYNYAIEFDADKEDLKAHGWRTIDGRLLCRSCVFGYRYELKRLKNLAHQRDEIESPRDVNDESPM